MAYLRVQTGPRSGALVTLEGQNLTMGRGERVGLQIPDQGASRTHAEILRLGLLYFIRDLQSRNGTYVNDCRVNEAVLREGDKIRIGDTVLLFLEKENSPHARVLSMEPGSDTLDTVRFRDTVSGFQLIDKTPLAKNTRKNILRHLTQIISAERQLPAIFDRSINELGRALGADRADVLLAEGAAPDVRLRSVATFDTKGEGEVSFSRAIIHEVMERQEAILTSDAVLDDRFGKAESIVAHAIRSVICVPILFAGKTEGVIYLSNSQRPEAFDKEDLDLVLQIGLQLSALLGVSRDLEARESIWQGVVMLALRLLESDDEMLRRSREVAGHCRAVAGSLGADQDLCQRAWIAGFLHALSPQTGTSGSAASRIRAAAAEISRLDDVVEAVECQDERHDGSGGPRGLVGDAIPLLGRILALAKELERRRSSASSRDVGAVLSGLREEAGRKFHPDVMQAALVALRNGEFGGRTEKFGGSETLPASGASPVV